MFGYLKPLVERDFASHAAIFAGNLQADTPESPEIESLKEFGFYFDKDSLAQTTDHGNKYTSAQIAFLPNPNSAYRVGRSGVFPLYSHVFRDEDEQIYLSYFKAEFENKNTQSSRTEYYRQWRTFQMSDQLPKWIEIRLE